MQRSIWRGAISFGLIYVPVELYGASKDGSLSLHLLDRRDFAPVGYQRINKTTGKEVDWAHIVKGYEYEKGRYVALSDADFKHANVKASETIDIANFTDASDIPAMYFDTPYFLAPRKGGQKVYSLLREALRSTGKVAVATFVMRGRQHLCAIAPYENALMLMTLRFASEVRPPSQIKTLADAPAAAKPAPAELAMAKKLVEQMSGPFRANLFKDTYRRDLLRRVQEKIRHKQTHVLEPDAPASERPKAQVIDLMAALKDSLRKRRGHAGKPAAEPPRRKAARSAKRA
jgi:DNA end-binding protein Ku